MELTPGFSNFLLLLLLNLLFTLTIGAPQQDVCTAPEQVEEEEGLASALSEIKQQLVASREALEVLEKRVERQEKVVRELREALDSGWSSGSQGQTVEKGERVKPEGNALQQYGPMQGKTIARFRRSFYDSFTLLAAVKADTDVTCICPVHRAADGLSRYVAVGDSIGNLYIFSMKGDLLAEHLTGTKSAITAVVTHFLDRNHTALLTGHEDGSIRKHVVLDKVIRAYPGGRPESSIEGISLDKPLLPLKESESGDAQLAVLPDAITHLFSSRAGGQHIIFFADQKGLFGSMWSNGSVITSEKLNLEFKSFRVERSQIAAFHEKGMSILSTSTGRLLRGMECSGLNESTIMAAAFDPAATTRAYASTKDGELLAFVIEKNFLACRVNHRQQIRLPPGPVNVGVLKGYIVLSSSLGVAVYNTTMSMRTGPREVILEPHSTIAAAFGQEVENVAVPLVASSGNSLLVLGLGGNGLAAMFQSNLPTQKPLEFNPKLWQQPIFIGQSEKVSLAPMSWKAQQGVLDNITRVRLYDIAESLQQFVL